MEYIPVTMLRQDLADIPQHPLPVGFSMRLFRDGDGGTWSGVWQAAEPHKTMKAEMFEREFSHDLPSMPRRCYFLVSPAGRDIGTVTAWYVRSYRGRPWGLIHYVAIVQEFQGRGLAKPMVTVAMNRLRLLGHRRAMLRTQTPRIVAIKTYLDFGFVPDMTAKDAHHAWSLVREVLPHPVLGCALA